MNINGKAMRKMLIPTLLVFGGVLGIKYGQDVMFNKIIASAPAPIVKTTSFNVIADQWGQSLGALGSIDAINGVELATEFDGVVSKIHFQSGQNVEKGDLLIELSSDVDEAQLQALRAAATLADQEYERFKRLASQGSVSKSELDRKRSERDQAQANAEAQAQRLAKKRIRAPFSGQLGIRQVDQGQFLPIGAPIVGLYQVDPIFVSFSIPDQQLTQIQNGQPVKVHVSSMPEQHFSGEITAIEPAVNAQTRNVKVQATLDNPDGLLRPGMFARVRIQLPQVDDVLIVPRTAISYATYGNSVFVLTEKTESADGDAEADMATTTDADASNDENQATPKQATPESEPTTYVASKTLVKLGREQGDMVVVLEGLNEGDLIASSGLLKLYNGAPVQAENDVLPPAELNPTPVNQ